MENCLKTQLKSVVENNNLDYLGMVRIINDTDSVQKLVINNADVDVSIKVVNGYLTDESGAQNYGTSAVNLAGDWSANTRYVSPGSTVFADKYINSWTFDIGDMVADISSLNYTKFNVLSGRFKGDVSGLTANNVSQMYFRRLTGQTTIRPKCYGNLSAFLYANAATLQILSPRTDGNLTFNLEGIAFTAGLNLFGIAPSVPSQDISKFNGVYCFDRDMGSTRIYDTWSLSDGSNPYICGLFNIRFATAEEIDRMLIAQATKQLHSSMSASFKYIIIYGGTGDITRTSASDAAVATLKSLGFTIKINDVAQ